MQAPCYKCENRTQLCHSTCEAYIAYAEVKKQENLERKARLWNRPTRKQNGTRGSRIR